ncbi:hypothetical protein C8R47DRAFT_1277380 [Mycena vitilis]|nr:hypothetical protein C8R47DRAFT_1277380 [Mycena vitilis]
MAEALHALRILNGRGLVSYSHRDSQANTPTLPDFGLTSSRPSVPMPAPVRRPPARWHHPSSSVAVVEAVCLPPGFFIAPRPCPSAPCVWLPRGHVVAPAPARGLRRACNTMSEMVPSFSLVMGMGSRMPVMSRRRVCGGDLEDTDRPRASQAAAASRALTPQTHANSALLTAGSSRCRVRAGFKSQHWPATGRLLFRASLGWSQRGVYGPTAGEAYIGLVNLLPPLTAAREGGQKRLSFCNTHRRRGIERHASDSATTKNDWKAAKAPAGNRTPVEFTVANPKGKVLSAVKGQSVWLRRRDALLLCSGWFPSPIPFAILPLVRLPPCLLRGCDAKILRILILRKAHGDTLLRIRPTPLSDFNNPSPESIIPSLESQSSQLALPTLTRTEEAEA